ncbi:hypothetical protein GH714_007353 [Hevea brasiliensis]|uniref:DNA 5'-3' helicase FANCJ n=1 Tax=Hevea brasiliensis TaxID=3981 RepID=A0A6A6MCM4_HEVBR|nr:hypothetical protein GH714_007353 [Hevea brasiliensis]
MVSATLASNKPNPKTKNVYHIGGIQVEFPYQPYGTQLAFMGRVISTLDRAQRDGHCHALLESPTGTGKSLSLLCSTLSWQQNYKIKHQNADLSHQKPNPDAMTDPLAHGGGFIPETQPSSIPPSVNAEPPQPAEANKNQKKKAAPTIFYSSRTHSQISQVIREYRKTAYRVPMAVLASRKHYCTNAHVRGRENIDEECKLLLRDQDAGCSQFKNANKVRAHPSLQSGGCHEVHDIEDLVKVGNVVKGCSYYAARSMADDAHWTGDKALRELEDANISQQCFPILLDCATKAIKAATDTELDTDHLSGMSVIVLEGLFSSLTYFFSRNGCHASDYQLALQRSIKRDRKNPVGDWTYTLSLWCLNPGVVFRDIANISLSVILTSGTLSPMNSFSSELGVQFGTCLEAPHVVDTESQVWAAVISTGPDNYPLNASYKTADEYAFQDALGKTLEDICMIVPAGCLVFFPSYKLMEKLCNRWRETGQWSQLNAKKSFFVEPRGGSQEDDFDSVLKGYHDSIHQRNKHAVGRKRRVKKVDLKHFKAIEPTENSEKGGAAFLAVCRGKVSEGMDFSDDNARVVIVVGIPFPNVHDIQVGLKKNYNDIYKTSKKLLSGNEWYCHQAFRALNQAIGRCIRHRFDYGAIILLDERYNKEQNKVYISKWLKKSIRHYDSYNMSMEGLQTFFRDVKDNICKKMVDLLPNSDTSEGKNMPAGEQVKGCAKNKKRMLNKSDHSEGIPVQLTKCDATSPEAKFQDDVEGQASMQMNKDVDSQREIIDLECDFQKDSSSRCSEASSQEYPEITIVKETLASVEFMDQVSSCPLSPADASKAVSKSQCLVVETPKKDFTENTCNLIPEAESTLNLSVNSHTQKKSKSMGWPLIDHVEEKSDSPMLKLLAVTSNCLGVQIMATDASNVQLLNKILFYLDHLEIQNLEASVDMESRQKDFLDSPSMDKIAAFNSLDRFLYTPQQNSGAEATKQRAGFKQTMLMQENSLYIAHGSSDT